jgi:hypothetical protein
LWPILSRKNRQKLPNLNSATTPQNNQSTQDKLKRAGNRAHPNSTAPTLLSFYLMAKNRFYAASSIETPFAGSALE